MRVKHLLALFAVIITLLILTPLAEAKPMQCSKFSDSQKEMLRWAYDFGEPHDLGWTLAAIAYKESSAGKVLANWRTNDFGVFQNNIHTAISRLKLDPDNARQRAQLTLDLISNRYLSGELALQEMLYWLTVRGNWREAVQSYNSGWDHYSERGVKYGEDVAWNLRMLKRCHSDLFI